MPDTVVRPLSRADDRSGFSCGNIEPDRFFRRYAGQNQFRHHIGTTYIAVDGERILGFVTVSPETSLLRRFPSRQLTALQGTPGDLA